MAKRKVMKPHERKREILDAARELFLQKEYEKTTIQDVMQKLQIAKGTTYHYFPSKEKLLEAVVQDMVDEYMAKVEEAVKDAQGTALEKMCILIAAGRVGEPLDSLHRPGNARLHTRLIAVIILRLAPLYARLIEEGCKEGLFQCEHPLEAAEFLLAASQFLTDLGCYPWSDKDLLRRKQAIPVLFETLLQAPKGSCAKLFA